MIKHSSLDEIAALHLTYLANLIKKASHGHLGKEEAIALKSLAKSSVVTGNTAVSIQITHSIIMTIPGIGFFNVAMILVEVGDISGFSNPSKLLAYAGLGPIVNQSGKFTAKSTKMSKCGSALLRYA